MLVGSRVVLEQKILPKYGLESLDCAHRDLSAGETRRLGAAGGAGRAVGLGAGFGTGNRDRPGNCCPKFRIVLPRET